MADLSGQTLGKYQLVERLGRGGMADVYKGYQPGLDRYVAVKVLHAHLSDDPDFITRFRREAKSVAELRHPHIVQVFDFDVQGEHYYMVMEYVEGGRTLKQMLQELAAQRRRLPLLDALEIVSKLADALAYAHGLGMVHRDIKPANVLIPTLARPVMSDFGIARLLGETGLTASGAMIGTPAYMSPEQGMGERGDVRSDIYALGIVLYEMLTGRPPYDADTPLAVILKHINDPLVPPRTLIGSLPEAVERIVLKCLAKDPGDRYQGMSELRDALRSIRPEGAEHTAQAVDSRDREREPTGAVAPPTVAPAGPAPASAAPGGIPRRRSSRPAAWAIAAAGVALALVAIYIIAGQLPGGTPIRTDGASTPTPPSGPEPPENSEVAALVGQGYDRLFTGDDAAALDVFNQALAAEPDNPRALVGWSVAELSRYGDGQAAAARLERAAQVIPDDPFQHYGLGLLHSRAEGFYDAEASQAEFSRAIESCGEQAVLCAAAYYERSQVRAWNLGNIDGALADIGRAIDIQPDANAAPYLYASRADIRLQTAHDPPGAIEDYVRAYELSQSGDYLEKAAAAAVRVEDYGGALRLYDRLLNEQAGNPHYLVGRGFVEWRSGDLDGALRIAQRAAELSDPLEAHYLLGLILLDTGQSQEAMAQFQVVSKVTDADLLYQASFPFFTVEFGREIFYDMARAARASGDLDLALGFIEQSLQRNDSWPHPYIERGSILADRRDLAGARDNYLKALELAYDDPGLRESIEQRLVELTQ